MSLWLLTRNKPNLLLCQLIQISLSHRVRILCDILHYFVPVIQLELVNFRKYKTVEHLVFGKSLLTTLVKERFIDS